MALAVPSNSINLKIDTGKGLVYMNNNTLLYTVKKIPNSFHKRRILCDANGNPIFTMYKKLMSMHERWEVYGGDSKNPKDLIFSVKRRSIIQVGKIELKVFLTASNRTGDENVCDYKVIASDRKQSCAILSVGSQSSTVMAKMMKNFKCNYGVTVHSSFINYLAFISTLVIILDKFSQVDKVTSTTFRMFRMIIDPFDLSGLVFGQLGETIAGTVIEKITN